MIGIHTEMLRTWEMDQKRMLKDSLEKYFEGIIEDYPDDYPNPSCLIFGYNVNNQILHIVAGCDNINIYIITAYYPDTIKFKDDLKTRSKEN